MAKVLLVASGKGGTGKTTLSSNLAFSLAKKKHRVLLIDTDSGYKGLDLALGLSDKVVFNFYDVLSEQINYKDAICVKDDLKNLHFISAPQETISQNITISSVAKFINEIYDNYDFVIIDCAAGLTYETKLFAKCSHAGLIIATPDPISLRGADKIATEFEDLGLEKNYLILNRLRPKLIMKNMASNIDDAIDSTYLPLLGIIPEDENIIASQNLGKTVFEIKKTSSAVAINNISNRLLGKQVSIMKLK